MADSELIGGLYIKQKPENAPDFVIGKASINIKQFREWMQAHLKANPDKEWINMDMLVAKTGKPYAVLDTWEPNKGSSSSASKKLAEEDLPF